MVRFLGIIEGNERKYNSENVLEISVRNQTNKDRGNGEHCELYYIFTVTLCMVSLLSVVIVSHLVGDLLF